MINAVNVAVIGVYDLDTATDFYTNGLGATPVRAAEPQPGQYWTELTFGDPNTTKIALVNADGWRVPPRPGPTLTVTCDNVTATVEDLRRRSITVSDAEPTPWGVSAQLTDPDGHLIILGQAG